MHAVTRIARYLDQLSPARILTLAAGSVSVIGYLDYVTGYEISVSIFYLAPVGVTAWYAGRWAGIASGAICCVSWYVADFAAGQVYSHPTIAAWNTIVRFGFFLATSLLITALRNAYSYQSQLARTDNLTELYSRRAFEERLEHDLALAQRRKSAITLVYLDLDDFKGVNDNHGHAEGDRILQATGRVLRSVVRQTDTVARLGGDEFALILPDADRLGAREVITNLLQELMLARVATKAQVTCSIGVVTFHNPGLSWQDAIAAADEVMYQAKRSGNSAVIYCERTTGNLGSPASKADASSTAAHCQ